MNKDKFHISLNSKSKNFPTTPDKIFNYYLAKTFTCLTQGVAQSFSVAYHNVDVRRKLLRITESAISWIQV